MLSGDFFYITSLERAEGRINAVLEINPNHKIFDGHFPGQPVVPGVCMMQVVKEILESALSKATRLINAGQLKFLTVIDPRETNTIHAELKYSQVDDGRIKVSAVLANGPVTYFKMNGVFLLPEN